MRNEASSRDSATKKDKTGYQRTERPGMREERKRILRKRRELQQRRRA